MASVNQKIFDGEVSHQIGLVRYSNNVVRKIIALLNKSDAKLFAELVKKLESMPNSPSLARIDAQLKAIREINDKAYEAIKKEIDVELSQLASYEVDYQLELFGAALPVAVDFAKPNPRQVYAAAMARPFQGKLLSEWMNGLQADKAARIRDAVRMGFVEGSTIGQIVQSIRGTKALNYQDGVIEINKRNAEAIIRTAVNHTANYARESLYAENADLIKGVKWISTLDARTSEICQARDGKIYPVNSGARPPAHINCRSATTPVLKSWRELGIDIDEIDQSTRSSIDGQVPESITYQEWLKNKPASFQDDILGKTKGKLFRDGGLTLDRFVNNKGVVYTLDQLKQRDAEAFKKAGL